MTVLEVANLAFGYGANEAFQGVTFSLEAGERAALVAPNGAGKSTLLRLVAREITPDAGTVVVRREVRVAYARQSHEVGSAGTVLDAFLSAFSDVLAVRRALGDAQHAAACGTDAALAQLASVMDRYHLAGGDELERRVTMIAGHLGFTEADLERPMASLSGGERGRLHLGVALAQEPDLLLLDEPTNHLDLDTIGWLERHLVARPSAMLVVSHDRAFLDTTCPITMEFGRRSFRSYPLRYSDYATARAEDLERERELVERQQGFIAKTEEFIRKNIAGQKTKQAQSRRKMLDKLDTLERPEDIWATAEKVAFRFVPAPRSGDIVLDARDLAASRGGRELFAGVELLVRRGERIGVVGPNGSGKTTLLKLLAGTGASEDEGSVRRGTNLHQGYFDQHLGSLDPQKTAVEEIRSVRGDLNADGARQYLARFRFWGDDPLRRVSGFSGGERSRLALAKLLLEPRNLLFLDEPTNHLDIPAAEILEEALAGFEGTAILVSHDRRFLEGVTTRVILVKNGEVEIYPGGFRDYEDTLARRAAAAESAKAQAEEAPPSPTLGSARERSPTKARERASEPPARGRVVKRSGATRPPVETTQDPEAKRRTFEAEKAAARATERKRKRVKELEAEIADGERELSRRREELKQDPGGNWAKLADLAKQEQALARRVDAAMAEWMSLSEELGGLALKRALACWLAVMTALPFVALCSQKNDDGTTPLAEKSLPALSIKDDSPDLMLTWIDEKGDTHVELRPADVPAAGRSMVRVVVSDREDGTRDVFHVADLTKPREDGMYATQSMRRSAWEAEIEKRRDAYMAKLAPRPTAPTAPDAPGRPAPGQETGAQAVIIYGASWCGPCHQAADYLKSKGVRYVMKDVEETPGAAAEMREKLARAGHHGGSIPVIDVRGQILVGFSPTSLDRALAKAPAGTRL